MLKGNFLVPDYYRNYVCKCDKCRSCCCGGWAVTVSEKEYFNLISLQCSEKLKRKIDTSLQIFPVGTKERYAKINPDYLGECPIRDEDGLCMLQKECGVDRLPAICRYYPRAPRLYPDLECSISNSCEKVLEDLIADKRHLTYEILNLEFYFDDDENPRGFGEKEDEIIRNVSVLLNDRDKKIFDRMLDIFHYLNTDKDYHTAFMNIIITHLCYVYRNSVSIGEYTRPLIDKEMDIDKSIAVCYEKYPDFDIWMEKIFANHFMFVKFPFNITTDSTEKEGIALLGLFGFCCVLISNIPGNSQDDFVDLVGRIFRVVEHSDFYINVNKIYDIMAYNNEI